jgi:hypothetical protein
MITSCYRTHTNPILTYKLKHLWIRNVYKMYLPIEIQRLIQAYARPLWTRKDWRTCHKCLSIELKRLFNCVKEVPLEWFYERICSSILPFERSYNELLYIFPKRRLRSV